jgi:hypothetical protein
MGVASMVIGIIALLFAFVPFCGMIWALPPAVIGTGLAIADLVVKNKRKGPKGMAIAGLVLNPLAISVVLAIHFFFVQFVQSSFDHAVQQQMQQYAPRQNVPTVPLTPPGQPGQPIPPNQPMQPMQPVQPEPPPSR